MHNSWWPGQILEDARYTEKRVDVLAARAARAFHEYVPIERWLTVGLSLPDVRCPGTPHLGRLPW